MIEPMVIKLGGRVFRPVEHSSIRRRWIVSGLIEQCGIADCAQVEGEDAESYARRLWRRLVDSPQCLALIGAMIIPAERPDRDWTVEMVKETEKFLDSLSSEEDQRTIETIALSLVSGFFESGIDLSRISPSFSTSEAIPSGRTEGASNTESGQQSYGGSPVSTLKKWTRLLTGRFERRYSHTSSG